MKNISGTSESFLTPPILSLIETIKMRNAKGGAVRSSSPDGVIALMKMKAITTAMSAVLGLNENSKFATRISKGMSNMPSVLWVAIVPRGFEVSTHPSVAICFGKNGEGIVAGLMESGFSPSVRGIPVDRRKDLLRVDVDGKKPATRYNNRFLLPLELLENEITDKKLVPHLQKSLGNLEKLMNRS